MRRFDARRYIIAETVIGVIINIVVNVVPTALSLNGQETVSIIRAHGLAFDAVPQLFMSAFMSALVPSLLTRSRDLKGKLRTSFEWDGTSVLQIVRISLVLAALLASLGMFLLGTVLPRMAGESLNVGTMLLFNGAYGGLLAALVTPSALLVIFGRSWGRNYEHPTAVNSDLFHRHALSSRNHARQVRIRGG